jgi:hypothetical protein
VITEQAEEIQGFEDIDLVAWAPTALFIFCALLYVVLSYFIMEAIISKTIIDICIGSDVGFGTVIDNIRQVTIRHAFDLLGTSMLGFFFIFLGFSLLFLPGLYLFIAYIFAPIVVIIEKKSLYKALNSSRKLVQQSFFRVAAMGLLITGINILLFALLMAAFALIHPYLEPFLEQYFPGEAQLFLDSSSSILHIALKIIEDTLEYVVFTVPLTLLYFDLRIRTQGFDPASLRETQSGTVPRV